MGDIPETAIFRRFGFLNAQNLLYMQAELVSLEDRLRRVQAKDDRAPGSRGLYAKNWFFLGHPEAQEDEQWELVKEIRERLKEYNEMIIQQLKITSVDPPGSSDLHYIQRYLISEDMDNGVLTGKDSDLWGSMENPEAHARDLLALLGRHNEDFFSSWVAESVANKLNKLQQNGRLSATPRLGDITDKKLSRWTFMITSVLASALPILSIAVLYCVQSIKIRLGLIGVFNVVLSCVLAGFTSAKRAEVFGVCAAFSAVCVVFVQVGADDPR
ncbi:hypothetical protein DIS24_g8040 [Lasiodiplodia hormozganensis]|uniref:DUF6594 domain-containing protein n=1 Tax=Lasiodiplodia hormozganensis TaxID=869390 RepID=A0AA40CNN3_9PEZI|nr:hypothetical protein DIS24_g8040 [Lasiodiplodia hormozganensis]